MTKRNNHLGYINKRIYTDIDSYEVFEENGKTMAVQVEKVRACKPEQVICGFIAHCVNNDEMFDTQETKEIGEPFEITQNRKGEWGYKSKDIIFFTDGFESEEKALAVYKPNESAKCDVYKTSEGTWAIVIYAVTKTGKPRQKFFKLGHIVDRCNYYYDYNF